MTWKHNPDKVSPDCWIRADGAFIQARVINRIPLTLAWIGAGPKQGQIIREKGGIAREFKSAVEARVAVDKAFPMADESEGTDKH